MNDDGTATVVVALDGDFQYRFKADRWIIDETGYLGIFADGEAKAVASFAPGWQAVFRPVA
jgi:hypothetical protein